MYRFPVLMSRTESHWWGTSGRVWWKSIR